MKTIKYQGDIKKTIFNGASSITLVDGTANRDVGIANAVLYSLFVTNWFANAFANAPSQELTAQFEIESNKTVTATQLLNIEDAAKSDLAWLVENNIASDVEVNTGIEAGGRVVTKIVINSPNLDNPVTVSLSKYLGNWEVRS